VGGTALSGLVSLINAHEINYPKQRKCYGRSQVNISLKVTCGRCRRVLRSEEDDQFFRARRWAQTLGLARLGSSTERVIALRRRIGYALAPVTEEEAAIKIERIA
jgi:hypothetical protein